MSVWPSLLESAIYSPSPHNVQPWRVRILDETEADLFIDSARTLPKEDPTGSFITIFFEGLSAYNQDFREVTKMFDRTCVEIEVHRFETGPFAGRDMRIKNRYIAN